MSDIASMDPKTSALLGALGVMVVKEIVTRFFRRSERIEEAAEKRRDDLIEHVLDEVKNLHVTIAKALVRLDHHLVTINETKEQVEAHGVRISVLETGHADLRARFETISEAKDD